MEILLQENAYDSAAFNVIVDGKQVDRVAMSFKSKHTQAHMILAKLAIKSKIEVCDLKVRIELAQDSQASPYPLEELLDMARTFKSVVEHNQSQRA